MITKNLLSKNLRNLIHISKKFTSGSRESRALVAKKRLNKENDRKKVRDLKMQFREALADKIENKYERPYKSFLEDMIKKDKALESAKSKLPKFKDDYYVPLKEEDNVLLANFDEPTRKLIEEGGRIHLYLAVQKYKEENPNSKIDFAFVPLKMIEIQELEDEFPFVLEDDTIYAYVIQEGKDIYDELKQLKTDEMNNLYNLIEIAYKESKAFKNDDQEIEAPFNTEISIDFKDITDQYYPKILFVNKVVGTKEELNNIFKKRYNELMTT